MTTLPRLSVPPRGAGPSRGAPDQPSRYLSPVRRIESVAAAQLGRVVALVFEDGPAVSDLRPDSGQSRWRGNGRGAKGGPPPAVDPKSVTGAILDTLAAYGSAATFAVIGSTAANYPDEPGAAAPAQSWGVAYDHYPEYGRDDLGGVVSQIETAQRIVAGGHELCNHSYRHIPFGPPVSGQRHRVWHRDADSALDDLRSLHRFVQERLGLEMRVGRPPHLIDGPTYEIYRSLGYNYLGRGLDGGGWQVSCGSYDNDVENIILGLQRVLEKDSRALSGWVISFKDGYNLSGESPTAGALPRVMQLLRNYGYRTVTASAMLALSPFADLEVGHPAFAAAKDLLARGFWVASRGNEVRPEARLSRGDLAVWALGPAKPGQPEAEIAVYSDVPVGHPYRWHVEEAARRGLWQGVSGKLGDRPADPEARGSRVFGLWDSVGLPEFEEVMGRAGLALGEDPARSAGGGRLTRGEALILLREAVGTGPG
jgi:peptidoglycan/xylan/chitin deacetylase (PgdA/CDA1 family)